MARKLLPQIRVMIEFTERVWGDVGPDEVRLGPYKAMKFERGDLWGMDDSGRWARLARSSAGDWKPYTGAGCWYRQWLVTAHTTEHVKP